MPEISNDPRGEGGQIVAQLNHEVAATILTAFGLGYLVPAATAIWHAAGYSVQDRPFYWVELAVKAGQRKDAPYAPSAAQVEAATKATQKAAARGESHEQQQKAASEAMRKQAATEGVAGVGSDFASGAVAGADYSEGSPAGIGDAALEGGVAGADFSGGDASGIGTAALEGGAWGFGNVGSP